nr:glutamate-1-semialdehyde 2,1-aminomutase, chloroplastic [Quercus suber]
MEMVAPAGPMFQVVTLSGNTLTMTSGTHSLKDWRSQEVNKDLDNITEGPLSNFWDAKKSDTAKFERFYSGMLEQGIYFAPSNFEAAFASLAHST